jgi:hypothetical protein
MNDRRVVPLKIDEKILADHPELAVLTLDLLDSKGDSGENEPERLQINLILDVLYQRWKDRQDFYSAGSMCLYSCAEQALQITEEVAEPSRPGASFTVPMRSSCSIRCAAHCVPSEWEPSPRQAIIDRTFGGWRRCH